MEDPKVAIQMHIFVENKMKTKRLVRHAPRTGDEIRLSGDEFYKVTRVVWCYDEPDCPVSRVNIEVEPA